MEGRWATHLRRQARGRSWPGSRRGGGPGRTGAGAGARPRAAPRYSAPGTGRGGPVPSESRPTPQRDVGGAVLWGLGAGGDTK